MPPSPESDLNFQVTGFSPRSARLRDRTYPLVVASHNAGKVAEIEELLAPFGITTVGAAALGLPEPEETGATFEENAALKARGAAAASGLAAIADDSGLVAPALGGAPGIYSARWAGPDKDFRLAMARVQRELGESNSPGDRRAYFVAVLALAWPDGEVATFRGEAHGSLVWPPRGERGFGYDPIFVPDGYEQTFGQIGPELKHKISHRARAFAKLAAACLPSSGSAWTTAGASFETAALRPPQDDEGR